MPDPTHTRPGTRRYRLTLEVSVDDVAGGYVAKTDSYEPGDMIGRGATSREAIADWVRESVHAGTGPEDCFGEVPHD